MLSSTLQCYLRLLEAYFPLTQRVHKISFPKIVHMLTLLLLYEKLLSKWRTRGRRSVVS